MAKEYYKRDNPLISIIIPVKNAQPWLNDQLDAFYRQTIFNQVELIYIDSGSNDRTRALLTEKGLEFISISPESFDHGETRNLGVRAARGKYVVMTVQDAWPATNDWLEKLLEGFVDDKVVAVCGRQTVPRDPGKNPVQWYRTPASHWFRREQYTASEYERLSAEKKRHAANLDDVTTMYLRDALLKTPFPVTLFGEDVAWGRMAIEKGYALVYTSEARVYHYHHEDYHFTFKRMVAVFNLMYQTFGIVPDEKKVRSRFRSALSFMKLLIKESDIEWSDKYKWFRYNMIKRKASFDAAFQFRKAVEAGPATLAQFYNKYCSISPLAKHAMQETE